MFASLPVPLSPNLLTIIANRITKVLKTFGATQAVVFDISKTTGTLVFFVNIGYIAV